MHEALIRPVRFLQALWIHKCTYPHADPPSHSKSWQCQIDITYVVTTGALRICSKQWHSNYDRNLEVFNLDPLYDYNIVKNCPRIFDYGVTIVVVNNSTLLNLNTCEMGEAKMIKKTDS